MSSRGYRAEHDRDEKTLKQKIWGALKFILTFLAGMAITVGVYNYYGSPLFTVTTTTVNTVGTVTITSFSTITSTSTVVVTSTVTQIVVQNPPPLGNFTVMGTANSTGWFTSATQVEFRPPNGPTTFAKLSNGHYSTSLIANTYYRVYLDSNVFGFIPSSTFCFVLKTQVTAGSQPLVLNWKC